MVTILFCDLVGSTALMTRLGDGANDRVRRRLFATLREAVAAHRGEEGHDGRRRDDGRLRNERRGRDFPRGGDATGRPDGRPYFAIDGKEPGTEEQWARLRPKLYRAHGLTNLWARHPLHGRERVSIPGGNAVHLTNNRST